MVFDKDNYLFFSIGDRGNRDLNPQDINRDGGKIYRLHDDGRIPIDNPFVNEKNSKKAIFSYGHRNPQGMFYDEKNNKIWIHEHGPRGGDEINIIEAGENYGWPLASYGINYIGTKFTDKTSIDGMVDPIHFWVPSIAPSGMVYVDNPNYPSLNQSILIGSLKFQYLHQCVIKDGKVVEEKKLFDQIGRVRSVELDKDKNIFVEQDAIKVDEDWLEKEKIKAKMILQVHDEVILEVATKEADSVATKISEIMSKAAKLSVPLEVESGIADNWGEAH